MQVARVVGNVVATRKDVRLHGATLLILQPLTAAGQTSGRSIVGVDAAGAGVGEEVVVVRGREASLPFAPQVVPTDATVVGIVDPRTRAARR